MSFKKIETQEELDLIIKDRLNREKEKFSDYDELKKNKSDLESQVASLQTTIDENDKKLKLQDTTMSELNSTILNHETTNLRTKIALQHGLPFDLADRLVGKDEAELAADAERFSGFVKHKQTPPLKNTEPNLGDKKDGVYKNLLENLEIEGE